MLVQMVRPHEGFATKLANKLLDSSVDSFVAGQLITPEVKFKVSTNIIDLSTTWQRLLYNPHRGK